MSNTDKDVTLIAKEIALGVLSNASQREYWAEALDLSDVAVEAVRSSLDKELNHGK
tara:strand:- start:906 stop:1073 length:168 start_codon:yes stop_codon:yes gene_type:complete